ncbi:hypothetical protein [Flavobacterium sp. 3-210]
MAIRTKRDLNYNDDSVTVNNVKYLPDLLIKFPVDKDDINFENCTCIFSILDRDNLISRKYVGAVFFENLNNTNIEKTVNGYLPEYVFCFTDTKFPLEEFVEEQDFKPYFKL